MLYGTTINKMTPVHRYIKKIPEEITEVVGDTIISGENKMSKLKTLFNWLVWSSTNANKISLTLKAGIPFLLLLGIGNTDTLEASVGFIGQFIAVAAQSVLGLMAAWGILRKLYYLYK